MGQVQRAIARCRRNLIVLNRPSTAPAPTRSTWNTSIQTEVSTRTTRLLAGGGVPPHLREIPFPKTAPRELQDAPCPVSPQVVFDGSGHGARVGPLSTHAGDLFEELLIQHKVRAFHIHSLLQLDLCTFSGDTSNRP